MEEKLIDIIIPAFNAHTKIRNTLHSISSQSIKNRIKVTIVNDCGDSYNDILKDFKKDIDVIEITTKQNGGPGVARQCGIDNTQLPYIFFMDSDDVLGDFFCLEMLLNEMLENNYDVLISNFIQQIVGEYGEQSFLTFNNDSIWMHGKLYSRKAIEKYNVKFKEDIRCNEDGYFNTILLNLSDNVGCSNIVSYYWLHYPDSITKTNDYEVRGYKDWFRMMEYAINEFSSYLKDKKYTETLNEDKLNAIIANTLTVGYMEYNSFLKLKSGKLCNDFLGYMDNIYKNILRKWITKPQSRGFCEASYIDGMQTKHRAFNLIPDLGFDDFIEILEKRFQKTLTK